MLGRRTGEAGRAAEVTALDDLDQDGATVVGPGRVARPGRHFRSGRTAAATTAGSTLKSRPG